jgi:hypothetical protein
LSGGERVGRLTTGAGVVVVLVVGGPRVVVVVVPFDGLVFVDIASFDVATLSDSAQVSNVAFKSVVVLFSSAVWFFSHVVSLPSVTFESTKVVLSYVVLPASKEVSHSVSHSVVLESFPQLLDSVLLVVSVGKLVFHVAVAVVELPANQVVLR